MVNGSKNSQYSTLLKLLGSQHNLFESESNVSHVCDKRAHTCAPFFIKKVKPYFT